MGRGQNSWRPRPPAINMNPMETFWYENEGNARYYNATPSCVLGLLPCSITITGNVVLVIFYGILLGFAAKIISDGAEMLLDLGLPSALIGGIVLPLLGAVPDAAMIIASGVGKSREQANKEIAVGMGTLAGSTIMLLTIPWLGSILLGRVDIINGQGRDGVAAKFTLKSFIKQGVSVYPDVTYSAIIMLVSALPYCIVQGADWYWGPEVQEHRQPSYIRNSALATAILAFILFISYLVLQVFYSVQSKRKDEQRRLEMVKRRVIRQMYMSTLNKFQGKGGGKPTATVQGTEDETKPLLSATKQKQYAGAWRNYRSGAAAGNDDDSEKGKKESGTEDKEKSPEDPKWLILLKSIAYLTVGMTMVTVFSDPMVSALAALTEKNNANYHGSTTFHKGQYIPIPVFYISFLITPLCSNASELVSSLMFAAKKTKINASLTFSQLYGAATMNNTLGLGIFAALVYFQDLDWQYSAEVTVILFVEFAIGIAAIAAGFSYKHTYILLMGFFIGFLYFFSIFFIWVLEHFAHWK